MIRANQISFQYEDGTLALSNMSFDTDKGQMIGVIGSNGAGKSTLFKCLTGLVKPSVGEILLENSALGYDKKSIKALRQKVNMVFQDPEKQIFFPRVYDDIAFGPRNLKWSESEVSQRVNESIEKTGLSQLVEKPVHYLSFGQKKRVAISGILAMNCEVIIFDEPEAGLDPSMKKRMVGILKELSAQGKKVIISSHNMDLIYELTDYVYVLHKGRLLGEGKPEALLSDETLLTQADLEMPWLVRVCKQFKMPLVKTEEALYQNWEARK